MGAVVFRVGVAFGKFKLDFVDAEIWLNLPSQVWENR
jgi:hypothetical protein